MNDELFSEITVFVQVARCGSFAAGARQLAVTPATVSRKIARLEARLGVRLLARTTRRVALTEAGTRYLERAAPILDALDEAQLEATELSDAPRGVLRVHAPVAFSRRYLAERLPDFLSRYPDLRLDMQLSDRYADLIAEQVDIAIRIGELQDSRLIARRLLPNKRILCAAPSYIARHGQPATPESLAEHACLCTSHSEQGNRWRLTGPGGTRTVRVDGRLRSNNIELLYQATLAGQGIALLDLFAAQRALADGRMVQVLTDWAAVGGQIHLVYPSNAQLPLKVRVFIDFLLEAARADHV